METERYLTSDQLSSLLLLADKGSNGLIDYEEFAERLGGSGAVPRVPGGALPAPVMESLETTPEELQAVGARTCAVLERHGLQAERLPALLCLWGGDIDYRIMAGVIASLPLGLSKTEAVAQLEAYGSVAAFAAGLAELRSQGVWKSHCDWAASSIPGPALRSVLQHQVIEAESRTLEPADFIKALTDAGVAPGNVQPALWLAEKTGQGDVSVAEFLAAFGGSTGATKKKRGMLWRMMGR